MHFVLFSFSLPHASGQPINVDIKLPKNNKILNIKAVYVIIATDERGYPHNIFLISRRGASNEYPQHMFSLINKKDISIFRLKKAPYLLLCVMFVSSGV